jgi:LuxR family transcriptional regulator, maltose regulon positive regulatory protein
VPAGRMTGPGAGGVVARPGLSQRLSTGARVTMVSASPGSGKTMLLRSWLAEAGMAGRAAWVPVERDERDPQRFWPAVLSALRHTEPGSALVRDLSAAPDLDGWAVVERLLTDLAPLSERLWLVVDDVHELRSDEALRQLELLLMRAPSRLRFVLATRHDVPLGLHRLRLEGELAEIRAGDLEFTAAEARTLFAAAGVRLSDSAVQMLVNRTEGWAAGLRLAALSLAGHEDPDRFAAEFSGTDRTVAEYLVSEVLDRQPRQVRRLLLRTSGLERVNGALADLLTGSSGGERILQDLEEANAFVVSLDATRSWFRYHRLFAGLLRLQLRRTEPDEVAGLHQLAATWLADRGFGVEAVRQAQAAGEWARATRLLADNWPGLYLGGQEGIVHALMAGFPAGAAASDAELAAVAAADALATAPLRAAERYLELAESQESGVREDRRENAQMLLGVVRLLVVGRRGDFRARADQARRVLAAEAEAEGLGLGDELRALALLEIGDSETWAGRLGPARVHLGQGLALARRAGRPYLEFMGLVYQAECELSGRFPLAEEFSRQGMDLAERHGWADGLFGGFGSMALGSALAWQGRLDEAEAWVDRAGQIFRSEAHPTAAMGGLYVRGQFELARGRAGDALAAFQAAQRLAGLHPLARPLRAWMVRALVRLGDTDQAGQVLARLAEPDRGRGEMRIAAAMLALARDNPQAATVALGPVLDQSGSAGWRFGLAEAFLLQALAKDALGDPDAAGHAIERALDLAAPDRALMWFLLHPVPDLLTRQAQQNTAHALLIAELLSLVAGNQPPTSALTPQLLPEPLSRSEIRVLRYLPTQLTAPEIAAALSVSTSTVKTHMRNLYAKLGAHRRTEAVEAARAAGLLAPSAPAS